MSISGRSGRRRRRRGRHGCRQRHGRPGHGEGRAVGREGEGSGLQPQTLIGGSEPANDTLRIQTLAGDDTVTVAPAVVGLIQTIVDLGPD
jgi:hypothetical protein